MATLLAAFERACAGGHEILMLTGYPGLGKSTVIQELARPVTHRRGFFLMGQYNQFQQPLPYAALLQALQSLIRHLLMEDAAALAEWRERLRQALGPHGRILTDVLPDLVRIIGPQPMVAELPPTEASYRFQHVFHNFLVCPA
jgi:predicted ATPase